MTEGRQVLGTIDAGGVYCSRLAAGGGFVFLAGTAIDSGGGLAPSARPRPPYERSEVDDIAAACLFLVSDESSFITGQTLHVNGGAAYF